MGDTVPHRPVRPPRRSPWRLPLLNRRRRRPLSATEVFVGSFALLIALGTLGLQWIPGIYTGEPLNWTDAVFTATSAVCVTGLIVVDTATYFTFEGQLFLLLLIQLGGLGMLTLASLVIIALGQRPSLRSESAAAGTQEVVPDIPRRTLIAAVFRFTLLFEAVGAMLLYLAWGPRLGWREAVWPAMFHSVSAFCNAGFSTNTDSLMQYQQSPVTLLIISALIICGGLGFVTIEELARRRMNKSNRIRKLSLHTRLVLVTTLALLLGGWALFLVFEWNELLGGLPHLDRVTNGLFMSVTARTAGFNTVDYAELSNSSNFLTILLMMIGGSPGSTAGGMKTTTFAIIGLLAWSRLRAHSSVTFAHRSIPDETVERAVGLLVVAIGIIVFSVFALAGLSDFLDTPATFMHELFEVVSAFNTVGLSMGMTPHLPTGARWLMILLMFVGRVGPLALAAVLSAQLAQRSRFRYAHEQVVVG